MPNSAELGMRPGVWTVTFVEGTSTEGARKFDVDMMSGAVTEATD